MVIGNNPEYANSFLVKSVPGRQAEAWLLLSRL
jgi:hypothetical protein